MRGWWAGALFIAAVVALFVWGVLGIPGGEYRLAKCWEANEDVMVLMFRNERGGHRDVSFSNKGTFSTVKSSWTKYAVDWTRIATVRAKQRTGDTNSLYLSIELADDSSEPLGFIDRACYLRVKERYGKSLRFVEEGVSLHDVQ